MADFTDAIEIDAPVEQVWAVMADVERWSEWTPSVTEISKHDPGPLAVGSTVRIRQPRLPTTDWTVDSLVEGVSFTWAASSGGVRSTGKHRVVPRGSGSRAEVAVQQVGPTAWLAALVYGRLTRRYLRLEVEGLKQRVEGGAGAVRRR